MKALFDLQAHHASMVMIPGDVPHGTPGLPPDLTATGSSASLAALHGQGDVLAAAEDPAPAIEEDQRRDGSSRMEKRLPHEGIGVVIITTKNMMHREAREQLQILDR